MFTIDDLLAYKAKAEAEMLMAQAKIAVTDDLIAIGYAKEQITIDDETAETVVTETITDGEL
jgi:hypothetical protein